MKILMLTPYLPYPLLSGGQIRTYNLLKHVSKWHDITLFSLIKDPQEKQYLPELEKYCQKVSVFKRSSKPFTFRNVMMTGLSTYPFLVIRNYVPHLITALEKELARENYDLIHAETFYMMPHIPRTTVPKLLVEQTIEYLGYESYAKQAHPLIRPLLHIDIQKIKYWEKYYWQNCEQLVVMSQDDKAFISQTLQPETADIGVVANGVDSAWFNQVPKKKHTHPTILSVGTFKWLPNIEAVRYLVTQVWPLIKKEMPEARLHIVGNAPTSEVLEYQKQDKNIIVSGRVEDIRDAFAQADVLVAPVFSGKGTRYKVLEAMASGTPVVATSTAVEGLDIKSGTHAIISDTAAGMAEAALQILRDPQLKSSLATTSKNFVQTHFDWALIAQQLDTIYDRIGTTGPLKQTL